MTQDLSFRAQLPRVFEVMDLGSELLPGDPYFDQFGPSLLLPTFGPIKLKQFRDIESDLLVLDDEAWAALRADLRNVLRRDPLRGRQQLFDKLNEAKGYRWLKETGHQQIRFVPRMFEPTPDLEARRGSELVACEVKTINTSEDEAMRRVSGGVSTTQLVLPEEFFRKLDTTLDAAVRQLRAHEAAQRLQFTYVVINFDDQLGEYAEAYRENIERWLVANGRQNVILDIKPPFYSAMK